VIMAEIGISGLPSGEYLREHLYVKTLDKVKAEGKHSKEKLRNACKSFEGLLLAEIVKSEIANARAFGSNSKRPFRQMEEVAVEMVCDEISNSGGLGLWKFLYEEMSKQLER